MSLNWVMLSATGEFVRLPNERIIYSSPLRTSISLSTANTYPGAEPLSLSSSSGCVHLTNLRVIYVAANRPAALESFSAPVLNFHDTHVSAPFFGPNVWTAAVQPIAGGGISSKHALVQVRMIFKDGGAYDFHQNYERVKEVHHQAVETAQQRGGGVEVSAGRGGGALTSLNLANINLEQLPAYEDSHSAPLVNTATSAPLSPISPPLSTLRDSGIVVGSEDERIRTPPPEIRPTEPPPGYEEVQRESVATDLERRLRNSL